MIMATFLVLPLILASILGTDAVAVYGSLSSNAIIPQGHSRIVDSIWSVLLAKSGPKLCDCCNVAADLTDGITGALDITDHLANEHVIGLYCLRANTKTVFRLDVSSPQRNIVAPFDDGADFAFLVHGFTDTYPGNLLTNGQGWIQHTIKHWAKQGVNVCAVDWGWLSLEKLNYFVVSQKNTLRVVQFLTGVLLRFEKLGVDLGRTTLAGHSLGAQIAGKIGQILKSRGKLLGSIYGLDPAGPCYTFPCLVDEKDRLDAGDAKYVQCIHSNIGILGQIPRCGCSDIYLNSGVVQPGHIDPITAHYFACFVFDWTLNPLNRCSSADGRAVVGVHNRRTCGAAKVVTSGQEPYCGAPSYGVLLQVAGK